MREIRHVVVIGGGIAGCATAYYLSAAGVGVTIVEHQGVGAQASGWSAGGVNPLHGIPAAISALALESFGLHLALWPELARLTGEPLGARRIEMAMVAPTADEIPALLTLGAGLARTEGFAAAWLEPVQLRSREPRVTGELAGALLTRGNGVVDSHRLTVLTARAAQALGAVLVDGQATGLQHADGRVTGVLVGPDVIACDAVVVAMGPWSGAAGEWLGWQVPVEPVRGEIVRVALDGPPLPFDVVAPSVSLFGRAGAEVWIGATQERRGFDTQPSRAAYDALLGPATALMPSLADARVLQQTVCLRPVTSDDLPIVGSVPGRDGVYLATGGGTKGILLATGLARAVSDLILTGETSLSIRACDPGRFGAGAP